ncbi:MAG: hypothetical protein ACOC88_00430 [Candidatus Bipolaricaulota bacterium]
MVNRYPVYVSDIAPLEFTFVEVDGGIDKETLRAVEMVLRDGDFRRRVVDSNYELGRRYFSYERARRTLRKLLP